MTLREHSLLIESWKAGLMSRRSFATRAMALGVAAPSVAAVLAGRKDVFAQDPTPTPYAPETHGNEDAAVKIRY